MRGLDDGARPSHIGEMTNAELIEARKGLGLTRLALAKHLGMSPSRLADYELGVTRGRGTPAPVPRVVELAIERLSQIILVDAPIVG